MSPARKATGPVLGPDVVPAPLAAVPVLVQVVTVAGGRCECTRPGCHGREPRCVHESPVWRLTAAPRDPGVPEHSAWRVPAAQLAAWCTPCLDHARRAAGRDRAAAGPATGDLLDLLAPEPAAVRPSRSVRKPKGWAA